MPRAKLTQRSTKRGVTALAASAFRTQFIFEFVKDFNATEAIQRAGYTGDHPRQMASELMSEPDVRAQIEKVIQARRDRLEIASDDVAKYWLDIATADPRELCPVIVSCCRYCYGFDHQRQYTLNEQRDRQRRHYQKQMRKLLKDREDFDEEGGDGYDFTKPPVPECPECHGVGISTVKPIDVTKLSRQAARLFNGYKIGKDGTVEIKLRDMDRAMENLTSLLGLDKKRRIGEFNPDDMTDEELDAAIKDGLRRKRISINKKEAIDV